MTDSLSGFRDKLYWRRDPTSLVQVWHCFSRVRGVVLGRGAPKYISLCGSASRASSGGQAIARPAPLLRCARCDVAEMQRRGWSESGPER